jgi:hypothetical protein
MVMNLMANYKNTNEHDLISDLIEESIEQRGALVHYIVRDMLNPDYLLGESPISEFKEFYEIPAYIESVEHFNGNGDIYDSFGINSRDSSIFQMGIRRFKTDVSDPANIARPREGDLVYLPFSDSLWEITKVKMDIKYFQTGKNYSYRLVCNLFTYSHESIETNTGSDFNTLGTSIQLDDIGVKNLLGINDSLLLDESDIILDSSKSLNKFDTSNAFGF